MPRSVRILFLLLFILSTAMILLSATNLFAHFMGNNLDIFHIVLAAVSSLLLIVLFINSIISSIKTKKSVELIKKDKDDEINDFRSLTSDLTGLTMNILELMKIGDIDNELLNMIKKGNKEEIKNAIVKMRKLFEEIEIEKTSELLKEKKQKSSCIEIYKKIPELVNLIQAVIVHTEKSTFDIIENFEKVSLENLKAKDESSKNLEKIKNEIGNQNFESILEESRAEIGKYETQIRDLMELFNNLLSYNKDDEKKLMKFGEWIDNIGEILNSINEISEKNRLIAINTSIEASKFGDKGKGFHVLTLEIQKLNESTDIFIKNINRIMESFKEYNKNFIEEWSDRSKEMIGKIERNENQSERIISRLVNSYSLSTSSFIKLTESTDIIDKNLTRLLESLQFQDIIKQQLDKVVGFLNELNKEMEGQIKYFSEDTDQENQSITDIVGDIEVQNKVILF